MRVVVDLDLHEAIQDFGVQSPAGTYQFKSQDTVNWMIYFVRNAIVQDLGAGMAIKFGMIATGDATDTLLAYQTTFTYLTDSDGHVFYECSVNFNTAQMGTAITGKTQLPCTAEIRYQTPDSEIIHSLNISCLVFPTILVETGVTPPNVSTGYPDASQLVLKTTINQPNGVAGLDSGGKIFTNQLTGVTELVAHKDQPSGYPGLDSGGLILPAKVPIDNSTIVISGGKLAAPLAGGDMKKSIYDTNNDGVVDQAALANQATVANSAATANALVTASPLGALSTVWGRDASGNQGLFAAPAPGISEAPSDGNLYGRKNAAWAIVPAAGISILTPDQGIEDWDYFGQGTLAPRWSSQIGGGGTLTYPSTFGHNSTQKNLLGVDLACAAANASYAQMWFGPPAPQGFPGCLGILTFEARVCLQSIPGSSADCPRVIFGIGNYFNPGVVDQNIVFQYNLAGDPHWVMYISGSGSSTLPATTVTPDTSFHKFKFVTDTAWGTTTFYIDGAQVGAPSIGPNLFTEAMSPMFMIYKTAGSTAAFKMTIGWAHWKYQVAT